MSNGTTNGKEASPAVAIARSATLLRPLRLVYVAMGLFLVLSPLALHKPGIPGGLKADEAAYLMMASSLAFDQDLELTESDTQRLFDEYPLRWTSNVIVFEEQRSGRVFYGKPYVYSLFAAPWVRLFGSNGLLSFNGLLLWAMIGLGWRFLGRRNSPVLALLFSTGFFVLAASWSYVFWMQPEIFNMFFVMLALHFGFRPRRAARESPMALDLLLSGAALAIPAYNKPMLLATALAIVVPLVCCRESWGHRLRNVAIYAAGALVAAGLLVTGSLSLIGHVSAYGVAGRQGTRICSADDVPRSSRVHHDAESSTELPLAVAGQAATATPTPSADPENRSFYWLLRIPEFEPGRWVENAAYFLWGRHTGLIHYFPLAALAVLMFLWPGRQERRGLARWSLLAAVAVYATWFLLYIGWNWQGGGGFVGNRYFVNITPALLYLVGVIRPRFLVAALAWGSLTVGPLVLTPLGILVPEPTLQAHTRNWPLRHFPLELTLKNVPGYSTENLGGLKVIARADQVIARGGSYVTAGRRTTMLLLVAPQPLDDLTLQFIGLAPQSEVEVRLGRDHQRVELAKGEVRSVRLVAPRAKRRHAVTGPSRYVYRLEVTSHQGVLYPWVREYPPWPCESFSFDRSVRETFFAGVEVRVLGPSAELERDLYAVDWLSAAVPERLSPSSEAVISVTLRNASQSSWQSIGAAQIHLSSHWLDETGETVVFDGPRANVPPLEPGESAEIRLPIAVPRRQGSYLLELDLVHEYVSWFAQQNGGRTHRVPVLVATDVSGD